MNNTSPQPGSTADGMGQPRRVHIITDRFSMTNTYLIDDGDRLIVVDPESTLNVRQLCFYLKHILRRELSDIDLIVLTHLNHGHMVGVETLRYLCKAPIAAFAIINSTQIKKPNKLPAYNPWSHSILPGVLKFWRPIYERQAHYIDTWLDDVQGLPGHPDWRVIASPGHTPESICLYNPFTYELLCGKIIISAQGIATLAAGTNRRQQETTLKLLRSLRVHYLYPGHGRAIPGIRPFRNLHIEQ